MLPSGGLILKLSKERRYSQREAPQPQRGAIATERRHSNNNRQIAQKTALFALDANLKSYCVLFSVLKKMSYYNNKCHIITVYAIIYFF